VAVLQLAKLGPGERSSGAIALLLCLAGVGGLIHDSLHMIFGVLLWVAVITRFQRGSLLQHSTRDADLAAFSRQLSREVYVLLYLLVGANQIMGQPPENLRDYLAFGVVALVTIHVLARQRHAALYQGFPTTSTTNESAIGVGRGLGCAAVAGGATPKSAVTR
jgi:hypothetical protein